MNIMIIDTGVGVEQPIQVRHHKFSSIHATLERYPASSGVRCTEYFQTNLAPLSLKVLATARQHLIYMRQGIPLQGQVPKLLKEVSRQPTPTAG